MKSVPNQLRRSAAFTLVELLVSMTVLSIMLISIAQAIGLVTQIWTNGVGAIDNFSKARVIMDLLDRDVKSMVLRADTAAFVNSSGAFSCAFYTNVQGSPGTDSRTVSLVQYSLNPTGGGATSAQMTLGRLNYGMNFISTAGALTPYVNASLPPSPTMSQLPGATSLNTDTIASGIIQFQCQFIDGSGHLITPTSTTPFSYNYDAPSLSSNPRVMLVSLLVMSNSAAQLALQNSTILTKLQSDFNTTLPPGPGGPGSPSLMTYSQYWNNTLNPATGEVDPSLPMPVRSALKVYSRCITLPVVAP